MRAHIDTRVNFSFYSAKASVARRAPPRTVARDGADDVLFPGVCARANADELRGDGITRRPWGWDTFPPQQYAELFRFKSADDIQHLMDELDFPGDEYRHRRRRQ